MCTFLQMGTVAAMAIFAHGALGETSVGFALSYAAFLVVLTYLWWRTGVHDPLHRPLSRPYVIAFLISIALFVGSVFAPPPWRFYLWGASLLLSLVLPSLPGMLTPADPAVQAQRDQAFILSASAEERFALFTIIVLGEVIVGVIRGV
jgi:low temperature requirement protein LtrA